MKHLTFIAVMLLAAPCFGQATAINTAPRPGDKGDITVSAAQVWSLDGKPSGTIVGTTDSQTLTNKTLTAPTISGGSITGITDLAVADGGTGVSTLTGIVMGNGTSAMSVAVAGTDYLHPSQIGVGIQPADADLLALSNGLTGVIKGAGNGGGYSAATLGTDYINNGSIDTSAEIIAIVGNETGSGALVFGTSPTLTTPNLGTPSAVTLTNGTGLPISTGVSGLGTGVATALATPSSANLTSAVTDETGSGSLVFGTSPSLTTPNLGTPSAVTLTNGTGLPIATGVSGLGSGIATMLATPSSANVASAVTNETGSGVLVFGTSPSIATPTLTGTPSIGDASAWRTQLGTDQGNAPIVRTSSLGVKTAYGVGAANSTALGTALATAVAAMSTGDSLEIRGPATYTHTTSLDPPAGISIVGIGKPLLVSSGLTDAAIIVNNSDTIISGLEIETNLLGVGKLSGSTVTAAGVVIDDVTVSITAADGSGIQWSQLIGGGSASHAIAATIRDCVLTGGPTSGYGMHANLTAAGAITISNTHTFGATDALQLSGNSSATVEVFGGSHASVLDALASTGPTVNANGARFRGDQADINGDGGTINLTGCDWRPLTKMGANVYEVIGGVPLLTANGNQTPAVLPVDQGGTNANTASGARTSLGLAIGSNVQAYDADLTTYAGVTPGATGLALLDDASASAGRNTLGASSGRFGVDAIAAPCIISERTPAAAFNPADATTYTGGTNISGWVNTAELSLRGVIFPRAGKLRAFAIRMEAAGTTGTNETSSLYIRKNGTTDTLVSSAITTNTSGGATFTNSDVNITIAAGDWIQLKWITPTWATNPTSLYSNWSVEFVPE